MSKNDDSDQKQNQKNSTVSSKLKPLLGAKHTGSRISAKGFLGRIENGWEVDKMFRYNAGEMLKNLQELADRFYSGDVKAVDEFLQLYCLDKNRP